VFDPSTLAILAVFAATAALERLAPGREFPPGGLGWGLRGAAFLALTLFGSAVAPLLWDDWLYAHQLVDARALGTWGGAALGFAVFETALYAWHRALHRVPLLWRFHQLHHSAERVDVWGANYFHPFDAVAFAVLSSLSLVLLVGVSAEAAAVVGLAATFANFFQHANVRTPRWLGYLIQRPESHCVHHERGLHAHNYADLPILDIAFGTFRNPATWQGQAGFWDGASERLGDLLLARDVAGEPGREARESGGLAGEALG
jgi:sterol desaturase/sphingolipid hydroxylase (fatty acid hydroxylase superfamily)